MFQQLKLKWKWYWCYHHFHATGEIQTREAFTYCAQTATRITSQREVCCWCDKRIWRTLWAT